MDLLIGSIGIDLAFVLAPVAEPRVGFAVGLGVDVPIAWGESGDPGVFLRLGARHARGSATEWAGPQRGYADWLIHAGLGVRFSIDANLATREPARYETGD
jgi:hypothetical protein